MLINCIQNNKLIKIVSKMLTNHINMLTYRRREETYKNPKEDWKMKLSKKINTAFINLLALTGVVGSTIGMTSCASKKDENTTTDTSTKMEYNSARDNIQESNVEIIDAAKYVLDNVTSAGVDMITGGITAYAKTFTLNILKDFGFDLRDTNIKYLERITEELKEIKYKLENMDKKMDEYNAQAIINALSTKLKKTEIEYMGFVKDGFWTIAQHEQSGNYTESELEAERLRYYKENLENMNVQGFDIFPNYVTDLAQSILTPNQGDSSKDIFYYYSYTLGKYDKWTTQEYKNKRAYIAYLSTMLISAVNVAKFDIYYRSQDKSEATRNTYKGYMDEMAKNVNKVFEKFQTELKRLDAINKVKEEKNTITYLPTNKQYSTRMATLTYNPSDRQGNESRQGLLIANRTDSGYRNYGYAYEPDKNLINSVTSDYKTFKNSYGGSNYTIVNYLKDAGFYANNQSLFDVSSGLFYGDTDRNTCGTSGHDSEIYFNYINLNGDKIKKQCYGVAVYHNWIGIITRCEMRYHDAAYYLCFMNPEQTKLEGKYQDNYFDWVSSTISQNMFYSVYYESYTEIDAPVRALY